MNRSPFLAPLRLSLALVYAFSGAVYAQVAFVEDAEYHASGALSLSNAAEAYRLGFTGKGVTIGIHDQPINFDSPEFSTKDKSITRQMNYPIIIGKNQT